MRDDFPGRVKTVLASRAASRCSNPDCGAVTSGPGLAPDSAVNVGVAAHITAASPGGPRYDPALTPTERTAAPNGIWLCQTCATLIDKDVSRYTVDVLQQWKTVAEGHAAAMLASGGRSMRSPYARRPLLDPQHQRLPPDQDLTLAHLREAGTRHLLQVGVVPPRALAFQARAETDAIEGVLSAGETAVLAPTGSPVLSGLGGVGKTQLAADYVHSVVRRGGLDLLVWVSASSRDAVVSAFAEAAALVTGLPIPGPMEQAAARLLSWLATTTRQWLVVLDDLKAPALLTGIWPPSSSFGRTIITTRRTDAALAADGRRLVEVGVFTELAAAAFVRERLADYPSLADDVDGLIDDLGCLPLALSHAVAFMTDRRMTCAEYRRAFASRRHRLADLFPEREALPDQCERTVDVTWSLSLDAADGLTPTGLARPLLEFASMLDSNGIPVMAFTTSAALNWLTYIREGHGITGGTWEEIDPALVRQGLHCLRRLSLVSINADVVNVHRVVQRAAREGLNHERVCDLLWAAADSLLDVWPAAKTDPGMLRMLRANAGALVQRDPDALWHPQRHPLIFRHADSIADSGNISEAVAIYEQVLAQAIRCFGPEDLDTFRARQEVARLRGKAGSPAAAVEQLRQLAADQARTLGPGHPDVFISRINLGTWQVNSGDMVGGLKELEQLLADASRTLGANDPITQMVRGNLLTARAEAGESADPIGDLEQFLAEQPVNLGTDHPNTLSARASLANLRGGSGDNERAIADLEDLLVDYGRVFGAEHHETLEIRRNIAIHRCMSGDAVRAARELEQLISEGISTLGPGHFIISRARKALCASYDQLGDYHRAAQANQELLDELLRTRHPHDTEVLVTQLNLAISHGKAGDPAHALVGLERLLTDLVRTVGAGHPYTLVCRQAIAVMHCNNGDLTIGTDELVKLLEEQAQVLGLDHPEILASKQYLARACANLGDPRRAAAAYESLVVGMKRIHGPCHPETLHARRMFALWLSRCGQIPQAVTELQQLLPDQIRVLGTSDPETLLARQNLANCHLRAGDAGRGKADLEELLADQTRILGPDHRDTLMTRSSLADSQIASGNYADAVTAYETLHQDFARALGRDDQDSLIIEVKLAVLRGQAGDHNCAISELQNLLPELYRILGAGHHWTLSVRGSLAVFRSYISNPDEAARELEDVLSDQARILGPDNEDTATTRENLAALNKWRMSAPEPLLCALCNRDNSSENLKP